MRLANRLAIITGAGNGIGRGMADLFAAEGAQVVVADIDIAAARHVADTIHASGGMAAALHVDVTLPASVAALLADTVERLGLPDIVVNNAGIFGPTDPFDTSADSWRRVLDTDLMGPFLVVQSAARYLVKERRGGSIIQIASVQGMHPWPNIWPYAAAKGGLINMTRSMAQYLGPYGVRVNLISPGAITRAPYDREPRMSDSNFMASLHANVPLGRLGTPGDVAEAAVFLASDAAAYITGANLVVDGGLLTHGPSI
jgi:NAD(P)-dependent dehydrogenase (short-subunit alcohol dehydrogenase family)